VTTDASACFHSFHYAMLRYAMPRSKNTVTDSRHQEVKRLLHTAQCTDPNPKCNYWIISPACAYAKCL